MKKDKAPAITASMQAMHQFRDDKWFNSEVVARQATGVFLGGHTPERAQRIKKLLTKVG